MSTSPPSVTQKPLIPAPRQALTRTQCSRCTAGTHLRCTAGLCACQDDRCAPRRGIYSRESHRV